jgi:predicted dinucleotide-binding enzyme
MSYSIIGFGAVGQALARAFARQHIEVTVASRREPGKLVPHAQAIGPGVVPNTLQRAIEADTLFLAVPFWEHRAVAKALADWHGKTVIDATNAFGVSVEELGDQPSSAVVSQAFPAARFVKGFNHLPAQVLSADPRVGGGRRVVFLSSDDASAAAAVATLAERLGFAPVLLGALGEGGTLVQARGHTWAPLIFQDLVKPE